MGRHRVCLINPRRRGREPWCGRFGGKRAAGRIAPAIDRKLGSDAFGAGAGGVAYAETPVGRRRVCLCGRFGGKRAAGRIALWLSIKNSDLLRLVLGRVVWRKRRPRWDDVAFVCAGDSAGSGPLDGSPWRLIKNSDLLRLVQGRVVWLTRRPRWDDVAFACAGDSAGSGPLDGSPWLLIENSDLLRLVLRRVVWLTRRRRWDDVVATF